MSRAFGRLTQLFTQKSVSKQVIAVVFSVLMVTSMAAPAFAAGPVENTRQEALADGSLESAVQQLSTQVASNTEFQHSTDSSGTSTYNNNVSEHLIVAPANSNVVEIAPQAEGDTIFSLERDGAWNGSLFLDEPIPDTINATSINLGPAYGGLDSPEADPHISILTETDEVLRYNVTFDQPVDFPSSTFGSYEVEIYDNNSQVDSTAERLIGIGYQGSIDEFSVDDETDEINVSVRRDAEVNESWYAEFTIGETSSSFADKEIRQPVTNNASDEFFNVTVDVSSLPEGQYSSTLDLYQEQQAVENRTTSDRILSISATDNVAVSREDQSAGGGGGGYPAENVSVYDRSPLPLRVNTSTAATRLSTPDPQIKVSGQGTDTLNKPEVGVFNTNESVNFEFRERDAADTVPYNGTQTQFVTARVEEIPNESDEFTDLVTLQSPTAESYTVEDSGVIDANGALDHTTSFDQSGHYLTYVVAVEDGEGFNATADGDLLLNGSVEVAGVDAVTVQSSAAEINAPSTVQRGESFSANVRSGLDADATNHLLVAYHEETFVNQQLKVISDTDNLSTLSADNISVEHSIDRVNGVGQFDPGVSVLGLTTDSFIDVEGLTPVGSILDELANESNATRIENISTDDNILDISANATSDLDDGTSNLDDGSISIDTLSTWKTGEYRLAYVAQKDGDVSTFSTIDDTIEVTDVPLEAALSATPTDPDVNETTVSFDASGTQGSVFEYQWDFDGDGDTDAVTSEATTTHVYEELGNYDATVTTVNPDGETSTASVSINVGDTVSPTAALDLTFDGESVTDGRIGVGERFEANASESTDNHRLATPYSWRVIDSNRNVVAGTDTETLSETTSFRLDQSGDYTVEVTVVDETGNEDTATAGLTVTDESELAATIDADDQQRLQDGLNASVSIENIGTTDATGGFNWTLTATGTPFDTQTEASLTIEGENTSDVAPGDEIVLDSLDDELTAWAQDNRTVGDVDLDFTIEPSNEDVLTSNGSTTVDVTYSNLEADAVTRNVVQGVDVSLRSFIENNGTATSDNSTATVTVENTDTNTEEFNQTVDVGELDASETQRNRFTQSFSDTGNYSLTVEAEDDLFAESNSDTSTFEVYPYALDLKTVDTPSAVESGEEFLLRVAYQANATAPVNASVNVSATEGLEHIGSGQDLKERSPQAGRIDTIVWRVRATDYIADGYDLDVAVESGVEGITERKSQTQTIGSERRTEIRSNSTAAVLQDGESSTSNSITIYGENSTVNQSLNISVQGGAEGRTLQGVEYLVQYPYGCVEQTTSAFLGALSTDQYYRDRNYNIDSSQQDDINGSIEAGVKRLGENGARSQSTDGGWNMWGQSGRDSETFYTMYALYGLSEVENDAVYGPSNEAGLNETDFDKAVTWMKQEQDGQGAFSGSDPGYYIGDDAGATGFALVSLASANETAPDRISTNTQNNISEIYANASTYLMDAQANDGSWNNGNERSTALAVWGLTQALDAGAYEDTSYTQTEMENAAEAGALWLADNQGSDGAWSPYQNNAWWSSTGDKSETTAYAVLALNETNTAVGPDTEIQNATQNGTDFLTSTYESRGSWGYTRASSASIKALTETTSSSVQRTVNVTFTNSTGSEVTIPSTTEIELNGSTPSYNYGLSGAELESVRDLLGDTEEGTVTVNVEDHNQSSGNGIVITGVENTQEVDLDVLAEAGN